MEFLLGLGIGIVILLGIDILNNLLEYFFFSKEEDDNKS